MTRPSLLIERRAIASVYHLAMRHSLIHCLVAFVLLMQGFGSASAAVQMAAGDVQAAAQVAELPPCHQHMAKAPLGKTGMNCCGTGACHCVMSCGGVPAMGLPSLTTHFTRQLESLVEQPQTALQAGHYGPPLRPPAMRPS